MLSQEGDSARTVRRKREMGKTYYKIDSPVEWFNFLIKYSKYTFKATGHSEKVPKSAQNDLVSEFY